MDSNSNPYKSPSYQLPKTRSLFSRLSDLIFGKPNVLGRLLRGEPIMQYGVLFFIDKENDTKIFAAVPLHEINDKYIDLAVKEAIQELQKLVASHEELQSELEFRELSIGIVATYSEYLTPVCTRVIDDWHSH